MSKPKGYYRSRRKDGRMSKPRPITGKKRTYRTPEMKVVKLEKPSNPWGRYGQRDIKRERDLLPNVNPDADYGWLAFLEGVYEKQYDRDEKMKLLELLKTAKNGTDEESAIALTELEVEYPDVYHHFVGKKSDLPRARRQLL